MIGAHLNCSTLPLYHDHSSCLCGDLALSQLVLFQKATDRINKWGCHVKMKVDQHVHVMTIRPVRLLIV